MSRILTFVLGTRPEIIKLSPVIRACQERNLHYSIVHTGQHYSDDLSKTFFEELKLSKPDYNLGVGSGSHGHQTGEMIIALEEILRELEPDVLMVQGDTNSVLAGGIVAGKNEDIKLGHVEAGLRSYNRQMPEEINRRLVDHVSDFLFAPTKTAYANLRDEGIPDDRIAVTGNTIVDAVEESVALAHEQSTIKETLNIKDSYALLTAHRAENVDNPDRFESLLEGVARSAQSNGLRVIYPIHPRAQESISSSNINVPDIIDIIEPLNYLDFLLLQDDATLVFTDSGGVQEESCILQSPCVTLRDNTERPETVTVGSNRVVGVSPSDIVDGADAMLAEQREWENPFGDGNAAVRILDQIQNDDQ